MLSHPSILVIAVSLAAAPASGPSTHPARILPQHQQALLFFSCYQIATEQVATELSLSNELHQKLLDRIAQGRRDAEASLAGAKLPANFEQTMQESAKLTQEINRLTRSTVKDLRKLLDSDRYAKFDARVRITMEEVLSLQVVRDDTDYTHRDLLPALKLSPPQQKTIDALLKDNHERMKQNLRKYVHRIDDGRGEYFSTELALTTRDAFRAALTPDQLKTWDEQIERQISGKGR